MKGSRLILVDDDELIFWIVQKMVNNLNILMECLCFENGKLAEEYFLTKEAKDFCHLMLLDINMPIMNGWELLESLVNKERTDVIHGHILTSSINQSDKAKSKTYSCIHSLIEKPITSEKINQIYHEFLDRFKN
ncbi:MAG: response regulator [Leptospira sp.]|nr:response regulator [Leptospira sp.]